MGLWGFISVHKCGENLDIINILQKYLNFRWQLVIRNYLSTSNAIDSISQPEIYFEVLRAIKFCLK